MSEGLLITLNAGSSTIKMGAFGLGSGAPRLQLGAKIDFHHDPLVLRIDDARGRTDHDLGLPRDAGIPAVLARAIPCLTAHADLGGLRAVGHRVVHGGDHFAGPVVLNDDIMAALEALTPFAPLHQRQSLELVRAIHTLRPDLCQTASFDTAFHQSNADLIRRYAIPRDLHDRGVKRYGFHGLSYKYIAGVLAGEGLTGKTVIAHLGSGASLCAVEDGRSVETSMGFSTLEGVPMATRCGALDPGAVLHLLDYLHHSPSTLTQMLYNQCGLLGVSGISADSRVLLESRAPEAAEAIALFTLRIAGEAARLATSMGGLDRLVFTAGIGENQPAVRRAVCEHLSWLGVTLDPAANDANARLISAPGSRVAVMVIPTDEELVIAQEARSVMVDPPDC